MTSVPDLSGVSDLVRAGLAYAGAGWFIGPLKAGTKDPGSVLGSWPSRTSTNRDQIVEWFAGTSAGGIFLHVGRSGKIVFDVDHPERVPPVLAKYLWSGEGDDRKPLVPFQRTRDDNPWRGHYLFAQPEGRNIGNSLGDLGGGWGEVRGTNGVIVVHPTEHPDGGEYVWVRWGEVPVLPEELARMLPDVGTIESVATDSQLAKFLSEHTMVVKAGLEEVPCRQFSTAVAAGESRHDSMVSALCMAMRDAAQGWYAARPVAERLWHLFVEAMKDPSRQSRRRRWLKPEFRSMLAFAVGQALGTNPEERRREVAERLKERDEKRLEAEVPQPETGKRVDSDKYFLDRTIGCNVQQLASDVLALGPLTLGRDGRFFRYRDGVWTSHKSEVRDRVVYLLGPYYKSAHATNVEHIISSRVEEMMCDPVERFWNVRNGMLDWRTGEMHEHDPKYLSTIQFPWEWDAEAKCPEFEGFLGDILKPDYVVLVWEMIAYLLYSGNPLQVAFMLFGSGSNGKGTLLRVLRSLIGTGNYSAATLTALNKNKFAPVSLYGKIANLAGDIDSKFQDETAMIKTLTGGDAVDAEHKYGERFQFQNWAVPIFTANTVPPSSDTGYGYMRRWKVVEFHRRFEAGDGIITDLSERLARELPGIAARARIELCKLLVVNREFTVRGEAKVGWETFAMAVDHVRQWIDECCTPVPGHRESRSTLYQSYRAWCSVSGIIRPVRQKEFANRLNSAGYAGVKSSNNFHTGLVVREMKMHGMVMEDPFTGDMINMTET